MEKSIKIEIKDIKIIKDPESWSSQDSLLPLALSEPEYFRIDDRSINDLVNYTKELAKNIKFYDILNNESGNWSGFLNKLDPSSFNHTQLIDKFKKNQLSQEDVKELSSILAPHEVLFLAFLVLMGHPQEQLNRFTERYLDNYYNNYLEFCKKPIIPAKANIIFEPKQNISDIILEKGTLLNAGEDKEQKNIIYELENDLLITSAQLKTIQTLSGIDDKGRGLIVTNIFEQEKDKTYVPKNFKTFGEYVGNDRLELGFAISSPLLASNTGNRTLTLTLEFDSEEEVNVIKNNKNNFFKFFITDGEGWKTLELSLDETKNEGQQELKAISFKLSLVDNIAYSKLENMKTYFDNKYPILKAVLQDLSIIRKLSKKTETLKIHKIILKLDAKNISSLKMSNGEENSDPNSKVFHPFGSQPVKGACFYFTHPDLIGKSLSELNLEFHWMGLPQEGFGEYYTGYGITINNEYFKVTIENNEEEVSLFESCNKSAEDGPIKDTTSINIIKPTATLHLNTINAFDYDKHFTLTLQNDFFQSQYPGLFAKAIKNDTTLPNPPYIPICSDITISSYTAEATIEAHSSQFVYLRSQIGEFQDGLIPTNIEDGYLFLGVSSLQLNKPLTLLWQTNECDKSNNANIVWEYWSKSNYWKNFSNTDSKCIIKDGTKNFSASGIITFQIPEDINDKHPTLAADQYWLRAILEIDKDNKGVADSLDIRLHVAVAIYSKLTQSQEDLNIIKPNTIKSLVMPNYDIIKISQPYSGFDGKKAESEKELLIRASGRLRHKKRAITAWDYERLILEEFSEVYMVKVNQSTELGSLVVNIIVNADLDKPFSWPTASEALTDKIKNYLQAHKSESATLTFDLKPQDQELIIKNLSVEVIFINGDQEIYREKLEREIKQFLSPWGDSNAVDKNDDIYQPEIINFIKTRNYIKELINIELIKE